MKGKVRFIVCLVAVGLGPSIAEAGFVTYTFGTEFSGTGATLSGNVIVTLDDGGTPGSVDVTIDATGLNLSLTEYIASLYLNFDPAKNAALLGGGPVGDNTDPMITGYSRGNDLTAADGGGLYDIRIDWTEGGGPGGARLEAGETDVFQITGTGITVNDFDFLASPSGGNGIHKAVLRARGLSNGSGSGFFSPTQTVIPEPGTVAIWSGLGLAGLFGFSRRRRKQRQQAA